MKALEYSIEILTPEVREITRDVKNPKLVPVVVDSDSKSFQRADTLHFLLHSLMD